MIRPDIRPVIDADIKLMYRMARIVAKATPETKPSQACRSGTRVRKTLIDELDLRREAANAIRLRRNFEDSEELYVPEIISDLSNETVSWFLSEYTAFRFRRRTFASKRHQYEAVS